MIVIALALLAEATTPGASPRKVLSDCLNQLVQPAANAGMKPDDFVLQTKEKCSAQEAAFQASLVKENRAAGMNPSASEADAKEQVQELMDRVKDRYQEWYDTSAKKGT